jgi:branched-chain amino acid transport system ATP-binding protein
VVRAEIWSVLAALKAEGESILLIDKHLSVVLRLADRAAVIEKPFGVDRHRRRTCRGAANS